MAELINFSKSMIKKMIFSGSDREFGEMKLDRATISAMPPAIRAEYFKRKENIKVRSV